MSFHRSELLVVRLLGPLQVTVAGEPRAVPGGKQQLLLSLLALADDQPVLIDTLIAGLWGSAPPRSATRALQVHVSRLRTVLQCPIENINNVAYRLPGAAHVSDVREFLTLSERGRAEATAGELLAAAATFETALGLWRGSALGDLAEFDAVRAEARRLEEARNQTLSEWVEACIETDQAEGVIGALRSSLEHDPLQEHRWRQLVLALHRTGRHGEALNAYRQARQVFIEELGIEPGRVLRDVHAELQRAELQGTTAAVAPLVAGTAPGPAPLIGRDAELDLLLAAWRRSRSGLQLVCLTGEAGVGKSRLADELAARAAAAGTRVLTSRADPQVTRPFHHFTELLRAAAPEWLTVGTRSSVGARLRDHLPSLERIAPEIAQLSPERREHPQAPVKHGTDFRLGDAVAAWLEALSQDLPLLLIFDDMHWADAGTVQLLRHVLSSPREIKVLIVVAMRQHHAAVNSERGELDRTMVTALLRQSEETVHVPLRRLTGAQTAELLEAESFAGAGADPDLVKSVQAASGGNPLFIIELARQLREPGDVPFALQVPTGIRQVIEERIGVLPPTTQRLLRWASVLGPTVDHTLLTRVAEMNELSATDVDEMLIESVRAKILHEAPYGASRYDFSHEIVRSTLYDSLSPSRRSALHGQVAGLLDSRALAAPATHDAISHHYHRSNLPDGPLRAASKLLVAGRDALRRGAAEGAVERLARGSALVADFPGSQAHLPLRCDLMTELGIAQSRAGDPAFRQTLLDAAELAVTLLDHDRLVTAVLANNRGWWSSTLAIDYQRVAQIETALALSDPADAARYARLLSAWAMENVRDPGSRATVLERSREAVVLAEASGEEQILAECLTDRFAVLFALFEDPHECLRLSERMLDLARRLGDPLARLTAAMCHAQACLLCGETQTADRYVAEAVDLASRLEYPAREWLSRSWRVARAGARGDFARAHSLAEEVLALGHATDQDDAETWFAGQLFVLRFQEGRTPELLADLSAHVADVADAIPAWRAAMAVVLAEAGEHAQAEAILAEFAGADFASLPRDILWLIGMSCLSIVCVRLGAIEFAQPLYERFSPFSGLIATNGTIDLGPVDTRLAALAQLMGDEGLAAQHAAAAVAQCHHMDAPVWAVEARKFLAARSVKQA